MERGSAQHGSRVDDELAHESAAVVHGSVIPGREHEELEPEALTEDEQLEESGARAEVVARSELARWLLPSAFPGSVGTLTDVARGQDAPEDVVAALESLPAASVFETVGELWVALGGETEHRPTHADAPPLAPVPVETAPALATSQHEPHQTAPVPPPLEDSIADLVLLPARVALGALRFVVETIGRGVATIAASHQSS